MSLETTVRYNESNTTTDATVTDSTETLRVVLAIITTSIIMVGMGCAIVLKELWVKFKKPVGLLTGILCQWAIMPALAYGATRIFQLPGPETLSILLMGSCPGGVTSNVIAYFLKADMNLSIAMTGTSVLLSLGLIPFLLYLYSKSFSSIGEELTVPFSSLGISIATLVLPLSIGIFIRWKFPEKSKIILRVGAIFGGIAAVAGGIAAIFFYNQQFSITAGQMIASAFLPPIGMAISYGVASIVSLVKRFYIPHKQRRAISVETGIQNGQIALGIIQLSGWSITVGARMILLPLAYVISQIVWSAIYILAIYLYKRYKKRRDAAPETTRTNGVATVDGQVSRNNGGNHITMNNIIDDDKQKKEPTDEGISNPLFEIENTNFSICDTMPTEIHNDPLSVTVQRTEDGGFENPTYSAVNERNLA